MKVLVFPYDPLLDLDQFTTMLDEYKPRLSGTPAWNYMEAISSLFWAIELLGQSELDIKEINTKMFLIIQHLENSECDPIDEKFIRQQVDNIRGYRDLWILQRAEAQLRNASDLPVPPSLSYHESAEHLTLESLAYNLQEITKEAIRILLTQQLSPNMISYVPVNIGVQPLHSISKLLAPYQQIDIAIQGHSDLSEGVVEISISPSEPPEGGRLTANDLATLIENTLKKLPDGCKISKVKFANCRSAGASGEQEAQSLAEAVGEILKEKDIEDKNHLYKGLVLSAHLFSYSEGKKLGKNNPISPSALQQAEYLGGYSDRAKLLLNTDPQPSPQQFRQDFENWQCRAQWDYISWATETFGLKFGEDNQNYNKNNYPPTDQFVRFLELVDDQLYEQSAPRQDLRGKENKMREKLALQIVTTYVVGIGQVKETLAGSKNKLRFLRGFAP